MSHGPPRTVPARKPTKCHRCGDKTYINWAHLFAKGWRSHPAGGLEPFVMCDVCETEMAKIREVGESLAA